MATLGNTGTPDTATEYYSPRNHAVLVGQMPSNGTLQSAHIYCDSSLIQNQDFIIGVYTNSVNTAPGTIIGSATEVQAVLTTPQWIVGSLSGSLTSGQYIYVAFCVDPAQGNDTFRLYGTAAGASATVWRGANETAVYPNMTSPWSADSTSSKNAPAAYITYTTGAGTSAKLLSMLQNQGGF